MKTLLKLSVPAVVALAALTGCTGSEGPMGPAGPAGQNGADGADGAANVIYSDWFSPASFASAVSYGITHFTHDEAAPEVTQEILDDGMVLVFARLNGYAAGFWPTDQVGMLPQVLSYSSAGVTYVDTWSSLVTEGNVRIDFMNSHELYAFLAGGVYEFRYVVIPGGVAAAPSYSGLGWTDLTYEEVADRLGIPAQGAS